MKYSLAIKFEKLKKKYIETKAFDKGEIFDLAKEIHLYNLSFLEKNLGEKMTEGIVSEIMKEPIDISGDFNYCVYANELYDYRFTDFLNGKFSFGFSQNYNTIYSKAFFVIEEFVQEEFPILDSRRLLWKIKKIESENELLRERLDDLERKKEKFEF